MLRRRIHRCRSRKRSQRGHWWERSTCSLTNLGKRLVIINCIQLPQTWGSCLKSQSLGGRQTRLKEEMPRLRHTRQRSTTMSIIYWIWRTLNPISKRAKFCQFWMKRLLKRLRKSKWMEISGSTHTFSLIYAKAWCFPSWKCSFETKSISIREFKNPRLLSWNMALKKRSKFLNKFYGIMNCHQIGTKRAKWPLSMMISYILQALKTILPTRRFHIQYGALISKQSRRRLCASEKKPWAWTQLWRGLIMLAR